eukprot:EG_transcript_19552
MARFVVRRLGVMPYLPCLELQLRLLEARLQGQVEDTLLLVEHPHVYTIGKRQTQGDILWSAETLRQKGVEVHKIDRGGQVTYHGPGQLVGYPIFNASRLHHRLTGAPEGSKFSYWWVERLQSILMKTVTAHGVPQCGVTSDVGIWVGDRLDRKVAAIGIQLKQGCSMHGFALNVSSDLGFYAGIVPCGLKDKFVTSLAAESADPTLSVASVMDTVVRAFEAEFQATAVEGPGGEDSGGAPAAPAG